MISGDSVEYKLLAKWTDQLDVMSKDFVTTVEIGVREGYGSDIICDLIKGPHVHIGICLLYTSPSPRDRTISLMPSSA